MVSLDLNLVYKSKGECDASWEVGNTELGTAETAEKTHKPQKRALVAGASGRGLKECLTLARKPSPGRLVSATTKQLAAFKSCVLRSL